MRQVDDSGIGTSSNVYNQRQITFVRWVICIVRVGIYCKNGTDNISDLLPFHCLIGDTSHGFIEYYNYWYIIISITDIYLSISLD